MRINPAKIKFDDKEDIIDYITKGGIPARKYFFELLDKIDRPDPIVYDYMGSDESSGKAPIPGTTVIILDTVIPEDERRTYNYILSRVYENRVQEKRKHITVGVLASIAALFFVTKSKKKKKLKDEEDKVE